MDETYIKPKLRKCLVTVISLKCVYIYDKLSNLYKEVQSFLSTPQTESYKWSSFITIMIGLWHSPISTCYELSISVLLLLYTEKFNSFLQSDLVCQTLVYLRFCMKNSILREVHVVESQYETWTRRTVFCKKYVILWLWSTWIKLHVVKYNNLKEYENNLSCSLRQLSLSNYFNIIIFSLGALEEMSIHLTIYFQPGLFLSPYNGAHLQRFGAKRSRVLCSNTSPWTPRLCAQRSIPRHRKAGQLCAEVYKN